MKHNESCTSHMCSPAMDAHDEEATAAVAQETDTTLAAMAAASGFNPSSASIQDATSDGERPYANADVEAESNEEADALNEAEARRRSIRTAPGAFHVNPRLQDELQPQSADNTNDATVADADASVVDAQVEAVAIPIDEAVATYQAVRVVDALQTSVVPDEENGSSYHSQASTSMASGISSLARTRLDSPDAAANQSVSSAETTAESSSAGGTKRTGVGGHEKSNTKKYMYVLWGSLVLVVVAVAVGLSSAKGTDGSDSSPSSASGADTSTSEGGSSTPILPVGDGMHADSAASATDEKSDNLIYHLMEMEIASPTKPVIDAPLPADATMYSSVSVGHDLLPTKIPGTLSRSLIVGWDMNAMNAGFVKIFHSKTQKVEDEESISIGPFIETTSISLPLVTMEEKDGDGQREPMGSRAIIVDGGADGESFAVSYRNRVSYYSSPLHEKKKRGIELKKENAESGVDFPGDKLDEASKYLNGITETKKATLTQGNDTMHPQEQGTMTKADGWEQRGQTITCDADSMIDGFGSSIAYSGLGLHHMPRIVVGSDSGHVRAFRFVRQTNSTAANWQRTDGGLLDPPDSDTVGKAIVAMSGNGLRFAVGYPSLGKVLLYRFVDKNNIEDYDNVIEHNDDIKDYVNEHIELVDEIYSEGTNDMFGQSLSLDVHGNFLVIGAKGYARAYWLRVSPSSLVGFQLTLAGDKIVGDEVADGQDFGSVVSCGRVLLHNGGCVACPFILDKQRIAISSPAYDNGRGRVLLYQYDQDAEIWQPLASPIEGEVAGEGMAHAVRLSPDQGLAATSTSFGDVRVFRLETEQ